MPSPVRQIRAKPPRPTDAIAAKTAATPTWKSSQTAIASPSTAAAMTPAFIARSNGRNGRLGSEQPPEYTHHERYEARALEALVVDAETARVLAEADIHQLESVDIVGELVRSRHGEIVVLHAVRDVGCDADAFPDQKPPH